jgi:putative tryptophan/tyrosine transport system substrate-binding protein
MLAAFKRLMLGISLIALAAGVLLYTDLGSRQSSRTQLKAAGTPDKVFRVALVQHASISVIEDGTTGIVEALAERGYREGGRLQLKRYNAEADIGTANAIAKEVTSGQYDLIISASTISLQTIANANKFGAKTPHVFGLVSDPYSAGVGIDATNHAIHPPNLTGYGSMAPVARIFRIVREMHPDVKSVGLAWNPAEANSVAQTKLAREVCKGMGNFRDRGCAFAYRARRRGDLDQR